MKVAWYEVPGKCLIMKTVSAEEDMIGSHDARFMRRRCISPNVHRSTFLV